MTIIDIICGLMNVLILPGTEDGTVKLWNAAAKRVVQEMNMEPSYLPRVVDIACNPSSANYVASVTAAHGNRAQVHQQYVMETTN